MIPSFLETIAHKLARQIASHGRLRGKYFWIEIKPARKGKLYGKGGVDKKPLFDFRITITVTPEFKRLVKKYRNLEV